MFPHISIFPPHFHFLPDFPRPSPGEIRQEKLFLPYDTTLFPRLCSMIPGASFLMCFQCSLDWCRVDTSVSLQLLGLGDGARMGWVPFDYFLTPWMLVIKNSFDDLLPCYIALA
jgi:hypothetical protein